MDEPSSDLEAVLLFEALPEGPDHAAFLKRLNEGARGLGLRLHQSQSPVEGAALFSAKDFHVLMASSNTPVADEAFETALASPFAKLARVSFGTLVKSHNAHLAFKVGDGPFLKTAEQVAFEANLGIADDVKPADFTQKIRALHLAVLAALDTLATPPILIHWRQSDTLQTPQWFASLPAEAFPGALVFHPDLFSDGVDSEGHPQVGFVARGAEAFAGRPIVLEASNLGVQRGVAAIASLLEMQDRSALEMNDRGEIELDGGQTVRLAAKPQDEEFPDGSISVTLLEKEAEAERDAEPKPSALGPGATARFTSLRAVARVAERMGKNGIEAGGTLPLGASAPRTSPRKEPSEASGNKPPARKSAARPANKRPRLVRAIGLDKIYNAEPAEGMLKHLLIGVVIALIEPLPGFLLLIATLIRGPLPKLTFICAILAVTSLVIHAMSLMPLWS